MARRKASPLFFPAACILRLLEAEAAHDPIPGFDLSLQDYCLRQAAPDTLRAMRLLAHAGLPPLAQTCAPIARTQFRVYTQC